MPPGNALVLILKAAAVMPMLNDLVVLAPPASVTRAVKVKLPARVGVPESVPPPLNATPSGRLPESTLHAYGAVPPVAAKDPE